MNDVFVVIYEALLHTKHRLIMRLDITNNI